MHKVKSMSSMKKRNLEKYFFISLILCFVFFPSYSNADISRQLRSPEERVLSSISHGQQFKAGDSIRYTGYETLDLCPINGTPCSPQTWWTEDIENCYVTLGLLRSGNYMDYTFGSSFKGSLTRSGTNGNMITCSFDKQFSFPSGYKKGNALAGIYVSYGTDDFNDWFNLGPWGEHIYVSEEDNLPPTAYFWQSFSNYNEDNIKDRTVNKIRFEGQGVDPEGSIASWELFVNGKRVLSATVSPPKSPIMSSPIYTLDTDDYPAGMITVKFSVRDVLGLEGSVSETVELGNETINGSCGTAAKTYTSTQTAYTGTFCSAGTVFPTSPTFFPAPGSSISWQCDGSNRGTSASCTATRQPITPPPPPLTLNFWSDAGPNPILYNTATILRWNSTNATLCEASDAWSGEKLLSGNSGTGPLTSARTYTLTCSDAGGSITRSVTVNVGSQPALILKEGDCSNARPALPTDFPIPVENSKTIAVCDQDNNQVSPTSWNLSDPNSAFTVDGNITSQTRIFTVKESASNGQEIEIKATKTNYTDSGIVTLQVDKNGPFSPPTPKQPPVWKEVAP